MHWILIFWLFYDMAVVNQIEFSNEKACKEAARVLEEKSEQAHAVCVGKE